MTCSAFFGRDKERSIFLCVFTCMHVSGGVIILLPLLIVDKYPAGKIIIDGVKT